MKTINNLLAILKTLPLDASLASSSIQFGPKDYIDAALKALQEGKLMHAQFNIAKALKEIQSTKSLGISLVKTSKQVSRKVELASKNFSPLKGEHKYNGPVHFAKGLWIVKYEDLPKFVTDRVFLNEEVEYFIIDPTALATGEAKGYKGLKGSFEICVASLVDDRFCRDSVDGAENLFLKRKSDVISFENSSERASQFISGLESMAKAKDIRNASIVRLLAARKQINGQLSHELREVNGKRFLSNKEYFKLLDKEDNGPMSLREKKRYLQEQLRHINGELSRRAKQKLSHTKFYRELLKEGEIEVRVSSKVSGVKVEVKEEGDNKQFVLKVGQATLRSSNKLPSPSQAT